MEGRKGHQPNWSAVLVLAGVLVAASPLESRAAAPGPEAPSRAEVSRALELLPRGWVENAGQWDEKAAFAAPGYFGTTWVTRDGELRHVVEKREVCEHDVEGLKALEGPRGRRTPCEVQSWVLSERFLGARCRPWKPSSPREAR